MPKGKYADLGKRKKKSIKSMGPLSSKRKLSRFGKKVARADKMGAVSTRIYISRTRAIKRLQLSLRDFR